MPATQRPWRVDGSGCRVRTANVDGEPRTGDEGGNQLIAVVTEVFMDKAQRLHNARLIVNAVNCHDDLLAALKQIVADWDSVPTNVSVPDEINVDDHWEAARAAIAKAIGK